MNYLKSEHMKFKRTISNKLLWIAPLFTAIFAWIVGGFAGFQSMTFYWWYSFLLPGTIAIICWLSLQKEKRAGKYFSMFSLPLDLSKFEAAKSIIIAEKLIAAAVFLTAFVSINNVISPQMTVYSVWQSLVGSIAVILASLWQIPLCLYLSRKAGMLLPIVLNVSLGIFSQTMLESSLIGWQFPYCWSAKTAEILLGIKTNGTFGGNPSFSYIAFVIIALSCLLFFGLTWLDAREFAKQEDKIK